MRFPLVLYFLLISCLPAHATNWYVGGQGHDNATGLAAEKAFRTLQHAADRTRPGDTVLVLNGTYRVAGPAWNGNVLSITRPGMPGK
jgi:hypothetical protein